jgi:Ca2+-binding RTX toxin-like protein
LTEINSPPGESVKQALNSADHSFDFSARANVTVYGGSADDRMEGVNGNQTFIGGAGADDYRFLWRDDVGAAGGNDRIIGFNKAEDDTLGFSVNNGEFENNEHITFDVREANGHTIFKLIGDDTGQVYNTIDVDAVGVPWYDGYFIG